MYPVPVYNRAGPRHEPRCANQALASRPRDRYKERVKLVSFNGRCFDLPLLEMAAFRYGCTAREYYQSRNRYGGGHIDVMDWLSNFGALRVNGGLDVLAKLLGKPGKMTMA